VWNCSWACLGCSIAGFSGRGSDQICIGTTASWSAGALTGGMQVPLGKAPFRPFVLPNFAVAAWRYEYFDRIVGRKPCFRLLASFGDAGLAFGNVASVTKALH